MIDLKNNSMIFDNRFKFIDTNIRLKNGNIVKIKDINLGDVLVNGSIVQATMKIDNTDVNNYEDLYDSIEENKTYLLKDIESILKEGEYPIKVTIGKNYQEQNELNTRNTKSIN